MNYKLCTLKITDAEGASFYMTVVLNGSEFRKRIAEGAELVEIID